MMRSIASSYPLGALATMFDRPLGDARAAVVTSAPTRRFVLGAAQNPRATPVAIVGGGVTPIPGLRLGASTAHGQVRDRRRVDRSRRRRSDADHVDLSKASTPSATPGSPARSRASASTAAARRIAPGAGKCRARTPSRPAGTCRDATNIHVPRRSTHRLAARRLSFRTAEATAAFRMTRELTLRTSVTASRGYAASETDQRVGAQMVWSRRWW